MITGPVFELILPEVFTESFRVEETEGILRMEQFIILFEFWANSDDLKYMNSELTVVIKIYAKNPKQTWNLKKTQHKYTVQNQLEHR